MDLRFRAHGLLIRCCIVLAQATGAAFQTLAGARLLFEGDADYQLSDEIIREKQFPSCRYKRLRSGFLDGRAGFLYAFMLSTFEAMIGILAYEKLWKAASQES